MLRVGFDDSMGRAKRTLEARRNFYNRAVHEGWTRCVFPLRHRLVDDCLIPEVPFLHAAGGLQLAQFFFCDSVEFLRHQVIGVPELFRASIRNSV
jgi:hypothetical protein